MDINFTRFEVQVLLQFLKDNINKDNLAAYEKSVVRNLFLAFLKLQDAEDKQQESMAYTE